MICSSDVQKIFPQHINQKDSKYYYLYIYSSVELFAEQTLTEEQYQKEKERISSIKEVIGTKQRGKWTCLYYTEFDDEDNENSHDILMAAYNDEKMTLRYAYSYKFSHNSGTYNYYLTHAVKWE